ncbi:hypothetical protein [Pseudomonas viridiflava]|uniref:hypothetical protein n=1 Tax=Pseudomonas viridiflava TaxID=33069 RepID=UPI000F03B6B7|nr:hypothetical protein [Pseudomonas viridiflava]
MKSMIKRVPSLFGLILFLGIVSGVYLAAFGIGHLVVILTSWPAPPSAETWPLLHKFFHIPMLGISLVAVTILILAVVGMLCRLLFNLLRAIHVAIMNLGGWLVHKTQVVQKEG